MKQKVSRRTWISILIICLLVIAAVSATLLSALYLKKTKDVENTFNPAVPITPDIKEEFDGIEKKNVSFGVGETNYPVFVRVALVITWKDADDIVHFTKPVENTDYEIKLKTASGDKWFFRAADGYYYYKEAVESLGYTDILIEYCRQMAGATPPDGYTLSVDVIVQTVQAVGYTDGEKEDDIIKPGTEIEAWRDAWGWGTTEAPTP